MKVNIDLFLIALTGGVTPSCPLIIAKILCSFNEIGENFDIFFVEIFTCKFV